MADGIFYRDLRQPVITADWASVTLTTTMKQLWAVGATSPTVLPANYWWPGKTLKLTANLKWTAVASTNTLQFGMSLGAVAAPACHVTTVAVTPVSGTSTFDLFMEGYATCRSVPQPGTAATVSMFGHVVIPRGLSIETQQTGLTFPSDGVTVVSTFDNSLATNCLSFEALRATSGTDTVVATNILLEALN
jgi:hypothetical protein